MITDLLLIINEILSLYKWVVIIATLVSMATAYGVLDTRNRIVWTISDALYRITEPALRPIRRRLPNFGGLDISPIILIFVIIAVQMLINRIVLALATGNFNVLFF